MKVVQKSGLLCLLAAILLPVAVYCQSGSPTRPFPQHIPYTAGTILPNHVSLPKLDADTRQMYDLW